MTPVITIVVISAVGVAAQLGVALVNASIAALIALAIWRRSDLSFPRTIWFGVLAVVMVSLSHALFGADSVSSWGYATHMCVA